MALCALLCGGVGDSHSLGSVSGTVWRRRQHPRRIKANARLAVKLLGIIWPEASIKEDPDGVRVAKATAPLLPDNPSKGRIRKL